LFRASWEALASPHDAVWCWGVYGMVLGRVWYGVGACMVWCWGVSGMVLGRAAGDDALPPGLPKTV